MVGVQQMSGLVLSMEKTKNDQRSLEKAHMGECHRLRRRRWSFKKGGVENVKSRR